MGGSNERRKQKPVGGRRGEKLTKGVRPNSSSPISAVDTTGVFLDIYRAESEIDSSPKAAASTRAGIDEGALDAVSQYLHEIGQIPLLTAEEEVSLAQRIKRGKSAQRSLEVYADSDNQEAISVAQVAMREGEEAREKFWKSNLRYVVSIAKNYLPTSDPAFLDAVQEGNIGLKRAVEKFDGTRGVKFSTYARWWIRQAIRRELPIIKNPLNLPVHVNEAIAAINRAKDELGQELGREPKPHEIAQYVGIDMQSLGEYESIEHVASLDAPVGEGEDTLSDFIEDVRQKSVTQDQEERPPAVRSALDYLSDTEREVLGMRTGLDGGNGRTLQSIGDEKGVTRERIRQIVAAALEKLRRGPPRNR